MVFRPGKTVNSYRRNHDIMGMLPIPPKAVERGLAPPDLFPHKSSAKTPVLSYGVSHQKQTPYPPNLQNRDHEFNAPLFLWPCSRRWATRQNEHDRNFEGVHIQYMCCGCRRRCSASAIRPSHPVMIGCDDSSIRLD